MSPSGVSDLQEKEVPLFFTPRAASQLYDAPFLCLDRLQPVLTKAEVELVGFDTMGSTGPRDFVSSGQWF
jgi:hypothetical protein